MNNKSDKLIDMHTHTCFSDGDKMPCDLVKYAYDHNISTMSITDHDTILGVQNYFEESACQAPKDINVIPGIELTAKVDHGRMHILGYGIDIYDSTLNKKMNELQNNSLYSVISYLNQLKNDYGITFSTEDIRSIIDKKSNIGRPDIAKLCVEYGYASSVDDAFNKYLIDIYKKVRSMNNGITYEECISLIKGSGGTAVIAHPHSLELSDLELLKMLRNLISCGLEGIEVYHPHHSRMQTIKYLELSKKLHLLCSGGTDYHGKTVKPEIEIGTGIDNNIHIKKLTLLDHLNR